MGVLTVADVRHRLDGLDPWYFNICPDGVRGDISFMLAEG